MADILCPTCLTLWKKLCASGQCWECDAKHLKPKEQSAVKAVPVLKKPDPVVGENDAIDPQNERKDIYGD